MGKPDSLSKKPRVPIRFCFVVIAVITLIFSGYEIVERVWLAGASESLIHFLHLSRGVGASVIVGLLVGWYILRTGPSIFPSEPAGGGYPAEKYELTDDRNVHFSQWFIHMRWLVCSLGTLLILLIVKVLHYLPGETFWPLLGAMGGLIATNLFFQRCLSSRWLVGYLLELQIYSDLLLLTALIHFSGGIENPVSLIYLFHIIISGILLERRRCYAVGALTATLFSGMAFAELGGLLEHYTLQIFPHGDGLEPSFHVAHEPLYVTCVVGMQTIFMAMAAYFTTTIMERLRAEEKRALFERQRLEQVVQATGAGLATFDEELRPLWLNEQIQAWLRIRRETGPGDSFLEKWVGGKDGPAWKTLQDGRIRIVERELAGDDDTKQFFQVTIAPLLDDEGRVKQVVELTQDITQRKLVEAEMMHSGKMAVLGFMAAGIAHEVGNPLASISTRLRLMEDNRTPGFLEESLKIIQSQIDRIERIIHGISQFSRPQQYEWAVCEINPVVMETINVLKLHKLAKRCQVEFSPAPDLPVTMGVKDQMVQVFLNLGLNAFHAMPQGGTLKIMTGIDNGNISIQFADTGQGMTEEVRGKIFAPFFTTKTSGLGLGLSIVHNIINAHGGRIEVKSRLGEGTTFTVILPVRTQGKTLQVEMEDTRA